MQINIFTYLDDQYNVIGAGRPQKGDLYISWGGSREVLRAYQDDDAGPAGFGIRVLVKKVAKPKRFVFVQDGKPRRPRTGDLFFNTVPGSCGISKCRGNELYYTDDHIIVKLVEEDDA